MDPLAAGLCGLGAMVILSGRASTPAASLLLFAAFHGVHRATRTGMTRALIAFPAAIWLVANLWSFVPDSVLDAVASPSSLLRKAPENLSSTLLIVALVIMVVSARARLGGGLFILTVVALGIDLVLHLVPSSLLDREPSSIALLVLGTEKGWAVVAQVLGALCMLLVGVGPIAVQPLPRRGGATAGAVGALLLCAGIVGLPHRVASGNGAVLVVLLLLWLVANALSAVGVAAMAGAGAKPAGWIGVGLVTLGILGLFPALLIFDKTGVNAYGFAMSTPFGLLGIGIALLGWKGAPLETARRVLGAAFVTAFVGGTLAWIATYLAMARVTSPREPWALAQLTTVPLATYGLVLWAALLVYLASPPLPRSA